MPGAVKSSCRRSLRRTPPGDCALPPLRDADAAAIRSFLDAIWAESGLAKQTLDSYRRDLEGYARWRDGAGGGLAHADRAALFDFLAWRTRGGYSPRSNARLLSVLRAFFALQVRRGLRQDDPTALLDPPKLPRSLPKALAESQIEALLAAPDIDTPIGLRDRAMLELMYAAGLRVSELVQLPATAVNLRQGVLRVTGKGGKERLVPLGEEAQHWLQRYLAQSRPQLAASAPLSLFVDPRAEASGGSSSGTGYAHRAVAGIDPTRIRQKVLRPQFATICSTMRRSARAADAARTYLAGDHADLPPGSARTTSSACRATSPPRLMGAEGGAPFAS